MDAYIANDDDYIYVRVTFYGPGDLATSYNNIFIDADNDPATVYAFGGIGSEMLIQEGAGYQEKNREFNEGAIDGLDWAMAPVGAGTNFEFRLSRRATYASDGLPVFTTNPIAIVLESENTGYQTRDTGPDSAGFVYTLVGPRLTIGPNQGQIAISWSGPGKLQSRQSLTVGSWQDVPNANNPYAVQPAAQESYYRLVQ